MKEIGLDDEDDPCWACQLTGYIDTWSHARRKRRMAMRQEVLKKQCLVNAESADTENLQMEQNEEQEEGSIRNTDPLLVCTLLVGEKSLGGDSDEDDDENKSDTGELKNEKMLRICMLYESGQGGKLSLETLRQYLVNKLNIRELFRKQQPSKPNKKKRKRKKSRQESLLHKGVV